MRDLFPGYYLPTDEEFTQLWDTGLFVLDANVLLDLYRSSPEFREELLGILADVSDRLWLPHQVAQEYHERRLEVIGRQARSYDGLIEELRVTQEKLKELLLSKRHPFVPNAEDLLGKVNDVFTEAEDLLEERKQRLPGVQGDDELGNTIANLFEERVGQRFSSDQLSAIYETGEERYADKVPPGYADKKEGVRKYGDLLLWFQTIEKAKEEQIPIVFITSERKPDWWELSEGKTIRPRPELVQEMHDEAGVAFYMYSPSRFMEFAEVYLDHQVKQEAIEEAKEIEERYKEPLGKFARRLQTELSRRQIEQLQRQHEQLAQLGKSAFSEDLGVQAAIEAISQDMERLQSTADQLAASGTIQKMMDFSRAYQDQMQRIADQMRPFTKTLGGISPPSASTVEPDPEDGDEINEPTDKQ